MYTYFTRLSCVARLLRSHHTVRAFFRKKISHHHGHHVQKGHKVNHTKSTITCMSQLNPLNPKVNSRAQQ